MTVQLIRLQAKEIAGVFYDQNKRSDHFRLLNPSQDAFVAKHWPHFVELARRSLTQLLSQSGYPEYRKKVIMDALIEDNLRSTSDAAREVLQADLEPREKEAVRIVDKMKQLPVVEG